jgi:hypothetical protein
MAERVIWKYQVLVSAGWHPLPEGSRVVAAAPTIIPDVIEMWLLQEPGAPAGGRQVAVFGTGHPIPDGAEHRATVFAPPFVWHLMERPGG